ncbi:winged helix-turn-helix domain-containing protein [Actinospica sp. MGRD01-02]|uniref:Winged helix-turn-helix domain-containing protein n=1 Tax=Actinospica acidithermotolerans TaxID=2828514 RepID=A0A941ECW1_9ACTN|nr:winged helix-turn-helix domain-containing protein [Actinospica acidithermotolerans]
MTAQPREVRERLRMEAADRFALGQDNALIAKDLRVHMRSVQRWRKAWSEVGEGGLVSKGPASLPVLSDALFAKLEAELNKGPEVHGFPDQTWTLARIKTVIGRRFHKSHTPRVAAALLHRQG